MLKKIWNAITGGWLATVSFFRGIAVRVTDWATAGAKDSYERLLAEDQKLHAKQDAILEKRRALRAQINDVRDSAGSQ